MLQNNLYLGFLFNLKQNSIQFHEMKTRLKNLSKKNAKNKNIFESISHVVTKATGTSAAFIIALFTIVIWLVTGPIFDYSDTWQLIINTGTTIITFLMVFLIQRSQNKDSIAVHLKLNELIAAQERANNHLISVEDISEKELMVLRDFYSELAALSKDELPIEESHSQKNANKYHEWKQTTLEIYKRRLEETSEMTASKKNTTISGS